MTPQFTYDNQGNALGVFLPIEDWHQIKDIVEQNIELSQWQKELLDQRMMQLQQEPDRVISLKDFLAEMEKEAEDK